MEKDFSDNLSLAGDGFDTVIKAKQVVGKMCPSLVSRANILAMAARHVVGLVSDLESTKEMEYCALSVMWFEARDIDEVA